MRSSCERGVEHDRLDAFRHERSVARERRDPQVRGGLGQRP